MNLPDYYKRQFAWRDWATVFRALPPLGGRTILDLGCGIGDLAAEFVARGARVIGFDAQDELLAAARARQLANAEFRLADLRRFHEPRLLADGIWSSFAAAFFPDLPRVLGCWTQSLKPGGWIALTEIDDFFGHEPVSDRTKALLSGYVQAAFEVGRYDFHMGRKLGDYLQRTSCKVTKTFDLPDPELSFSGPACPEVIDAWRSRLDGMRLLRDFCGSEFDQVQNEFLACLSRPDHRSTARVCCCMAVSGLPSGDPSFPKANAEDSCGAPPPG